MLKAIITVASLAAAGAAFAAAPSHLTDTQYLEAARCRVLIASPTLGAGDTGPIDATLKTEGRSRVGAVMDRAADVQSSTEMTLRHSGSDGKAKLMAERNGLCQTLAGTAVAPSAGMQSGAN